MTWTLDSARPVPRPANLDARRSDRIAAWREKMRVGAIQEPRSHISTLTEWYDDLHLSTPQIKAYSIAVLLAIGIAFLIVFLAPPTHASTVTVGEFTRELAAAKHTSIEALDLPTIDPGRTLTHGDVVVISEAVGVKVSTDTPNEPFNSELAATYFRVFGAVLRQGQGHGPKPGRGRGRCHHHSPSNPDDCPGSE